MWSIRSRVIADGPQESALDENLMSLSRPASSQSRRIALYDTRRINKSTDATYYDIILSESYAAQVVRRDSPMQSLGR